MTQDARADVFRQVREAVEFQRLEDVRNDICKFAEYTQVDENGNSFKLGQHHIEWYNIIWNQVRDVVEPGKWPRPAKNELLLFAPREHGKTSTMVTVLQFLLGKNPRLRIKYVSRNEDVSLDVVGQVKKNIERNPRLHEVFPNLKKDPNGAWSGSALDVQKVSSDGEWFEADLGIKDANLEAYGITAPATGGRADLIIFDDIIGSREAIYEPGRLEKISKAFYMDWMNIGGKRHIVIGTPWTPDDILAQLSQDEEWLQWKKAAINEAGEPLWPEKWPVDALMARKKKIGPVAFDLQFMLTGIVHRQTWWTPEIIDPCKDKYTKFGYVPNDFEIDGIVVGFDPAASMKRDGSFSCVFCLLYDKFKRKVVYRIIRKRAAPREMAETIVDLMLEIEAKLTRQVDLVTVENNATQQAFIDLINLVCEARRLNLRVPIVGAFTGSQKWNPELGLPRMVGDFENMKWIIPWGDEAHKGKMDPLHTCELCSWIAEMEGYPHETPTTDMIMASWLAASSIDKPTIGELPTTVQVRRASVTNINW